MAAELVTQVQPLPPPETIRTLAEEVIRRPDYSLEPGADLSFIAKYIKSVVEWIGSFFQSLYELSPPLYFGTMILLFLILIVLVAHIVYSFRLALQGHRTILAMSEQEELALETPEAWEQKAAQALAKDDYITAVRCLFRASLLRLETAKKKTVRRGQTNREYLRRFRDTPAFEPLGALVEVIDNKWYAGAGCSPEDYQSGAQAYARIRQIAGSTGETPVPQGGKAVHANGS
ncbi:MAG: DUF4129 domain-containing protein [Planctomycetota bacterium]|nr:DUF4129 domain-containing protein [Planctomycetota bacterium]